MNRFLIATVALAASVGGAFAASVTNSDSETRVLIVVEGSKSDEVSVAPGATESFCAAGCFVTMPNGDHEALKGTETIVISDKKATFTTPK